MSNNLIEIVDLLHGKVQRTNPNNPKSNTGSALLKMNPKWEEQMQDFVELSFDVLALQFSKDSSDSPAGTSKLTNTSRIIGQRIGKQLNREPLGISTELRLGDLFIEMYKKLGYIDLEYPKRRDSSYVIVATDKWTRIGTSNERLDAIRLRGTVFEPPELIHGDVQHVDDRRFDVIKNSELTVDPEAKWVKAIDKLQSVGWKINSRVLDALHRDREHFVSVKPIKDDAEREQKRISKNMEWKYILQKADDLVEAEAFYQYMDTDYRGRMYCIEPFLNFQGSDLARGLLLFSKGRVMTEDGLRWLAIHTASSFNMSYHIDSIPKWCTQDYKSHLEREGLDNISVDKMTLADRIQWTNEYMDDIRAAGEDLLMSGEAEKSVSFLAACIEWFNYHEAVAKGELYISHLPIPIDGSNNGWQHLGAISKDTHTGELVGLIPVDIQKDFYVQTAKKLIELCKVDRLKKILVKMPMKSIRKGISKRGSMTRAYSAGRAKIGENMYSDCKQEDYHKKYGITEKDCNRFAQLLIKSIDAVCPGPLETMSFLQELACFEIGKYEMHDADDALVDKAEYKKLRARRDVLLDNKEPTEEELDELNSIIKLTDTYTYKKTYGNGKDYLGWTTPSGFVVHYENWVMSSYKVIGRLDGRYIKHVAQIPTDRPDMRGFMCGISPNFIHSLDASHMALTIEGWYGEFGAVHDSFSTHASDVDNLLQLTKDKFIAMYNVDNFYDYIQSQLITDASGIDVVQPVLGDLNIEGVVDSDYFFA